MKKISLLAALALVAVSLMLVTIQVMAGADAVGPKKTPSPFAVTGTPGTGLPPGPPSGASNGMGPQVPPGPPANPQSNSQAGLHGKPTIYRGTIQLVSSSSLTLTLVDGSSVTMGITPDTKIRVPGPKANGDTLVVGMHVVAMAITDSNNNLVARAVMAIPGQPVRVHRVGTVTAYTAGSSITIKATDGNTYIFTLTSAT